PRANACWHAIGERRRLSSAIDGRARLALTAGLRLAFRRVFADDAFVALQLPALVGAMREPVGDADLAVYRTGAHGDAGLVAGGDDFLETKLLAVAENGDERNEHADLSKTGPATQPLQGSCHEGAAIPEITGDAAIRDVQDPTEKNAYGRSRSPA